MERVPATGDEAAAVCENCAREDDDLVQVWPASGGGDQAELWCAGCRSEFPHEPVTEDDEAPADG
jgi:hypothetical protein